MRQEFWSARAELVRSVADLPIRAAAIKLGLSAATVAKYRKLEGFRAPCTSRIEAARECAEQGLTRSEAAVKLGVTYQTVAAYGRAHNIEFRHAKEGVGVDLSRAETMASMFKSGKTLEQIGQLYGISRERVRQIITKHHGLRAPDGGNHTKAKQRALRAKAKKDAECMEKFGCTVAGLKELRALGRAMMATGVSRDRTPTQAFVRQKTNARGRGIGWELTLAQWWSIWQESGKWEERGRGQGYMMCRFGDVGPYAVGNVYIATGVHNGAIQPNNPGRLSHPRHAEYLEQRRAAA